MKKLNKGLGLLTLITAVTMIVSVANCGGTTDSQIKGKTYKTEGWVDDNTFRVSALGAPAPDAEGKVKRRTQAREAALIMAQKRIVEKMIGAEIKGASAAKDGESAGIVVTKEFQGIVKGGSVVQETFDDEDNCEIIFEVTEKNLKKKAKLEIDRLNKQ